MAIPSLKAASHRGVLREILKVACQKCVQFDEMSTFRLRVNLPDERSLGPLGADERVLPAHEIHIARPQEAVVSRLRKKWQDMHRQ